MYCIVSFRPERYIQTAERVERAEEAEEVEENEIHVETRLIASLHVFRFHMKYVKERSFPDMTSVIPVKSLISYLYGRPVGVYHENTVQDQVLSNNTGIGSFL